MEDSTYCFRLGEDASSLQHIYWGPGIASAQAIEMSHATAPLRIAFESPKGIILRSMPRGARCVSLNQA